VLILEVALLLIGSVICVDLYNRLAISESQIEINFRKIKSQHDSFRNHVLKQESIASKLFSDLGVKSAEIDLAAKQRDVNLLKAIDDLKPKIPDPCKYDPESFRKKAVTKKYKK
jgi:hypothetical protein